MFRPEDVCGDSKGADQADEGQPPVELRSREKTKRIHRRFTERDRVQTRRGKTHDRLLSRLRCVEKAGLTPFAHDQNPVRQQQQFRHFRTHDHDAQPVRRQLEYELIDLLLRPHVDSAGRLVEQQDPRRGRQPFADDDLLLVAARQGRDDLFDVVAAHGQPFDHVGGEGRFADEGAKAEAGQRADRRKGDIVAYARRQEQSARLSIFRHERDAELAGVRRRIDGRRLAVDRDFAASPTARGAEDRLEDLGAARSEEPSDSQDLASPQSRSSRPEGRAASRAG